MELPRVDPVAVIEHPNDYTASARSSRSAVATDRDRAAAARKSLSRAENHHAQQSKRDHNSANDGDSVEIVVHCLSPHSRKRTNRLDNAVPPDLAHAALAAQASDFVGAQARAWCKSHGFPSVCEGEYMPGRGLAGEVHTAKEVFTPFDRVHRTSPSSPMLVFADGTGEGQG